MSFISDEMKRNLQNGGGIREAFNEAAKQREYYGADVVCDLSLGNPSALPPEEVQQVMQRLSMDQQLSHQYMCEAGYEEVRKKIADSLNQKHKTEYTCDNVIMTNGVAGGMNMVLRAILEPGDEVVLFRPYYPAYLGFIGNWSAKAVMVDPLEETFEPDLDDLKRKITDRTKVVIVNSPHNPTGIIYSRKVMTDIAEILKEKQKEYQTTICLLSDEPYRDLVYNGEKLTWWPEIYQNTIVSYSFSKSLSLAGERIGYLLIPSEFTDSEQVIRAVRLAMGRLGFVNAPAFFQRIAGECVDTKVDLEYYKKNREILYTALKRLGYCCTVPEGGFYIFVKAPNGNEKQFMEMAQKRHLIFVGGSSFGMEGYARLSFCCEYKVLERAVPALELLAKDMGIVNI